MDITNICGLQNIGNTCFMNSALQLLVNCTVLSKFILNNNFKSEKINLYKKFLSDYFKNKVITPNSVKVLVSQQNNIFSGYDQQDSHEFLVCIIDILNEEFKKEHEHNPKEIIGISMDNLISNLFNTNITSIIYCEKTGDKSKNKVGEAILSLPIRNSASNLTECINDFTVIEKLDGDAKWLNEKDNNYYDAHKRLFIKTLPKYLIIHLKRFGFDRFSRKNNSEVKMDFKIKINDSNFELRSIVFHMGNTGGGHYVSLVHKDDKWFLFNDSNVSEITNINNYINKGYIYLYSKCKK